MNVARRLAIKTLRLKMAQLDVPYAGRARTAGGVEPVKWSLVSGKLPLGVRFAPRLGSAPRNSSPVWDLPSSSRGDDALGAKAKKALVLKVES